MFFKKKSSLDLLGVRLSDLQMMLKPTSIKAIIKHNTLVAKQENTTTVLSVDAPIKPDTESGPIRAVIRLKTELPPQIQSLLKTEDGASAMNAFAALGALTLEEGNVYLGSRLTIYSEEDAWATLHLPLLAFTLICDPHAILGGMRRSFAGEDSRGGDSEWKPEDLALVQSYLSRVCVCNADDDGLTAEFALEPGAISAGMGRGKTALFQLHTDQPHPELGGGMFCLLQFPQRFEGEDKLNMACNLLNQIEMTDEDMPPHFGAWCPGRAGNIAAYVSFLPNALHRVNGIAINVAVWAMNRAALANALLDRLAD